MASDPISVAQLITGLNRGGAEAQVVAIANALSALGHRVSIISLMEANEWARDAADSAVKIHAVGMRQGKPSLRRVRRVRQIIAAERCDVLHAHMIHANLASRIVTLGLPTVLVNTIHNIHQTDNRALLAAAAMTKGVPTWTTAVSRAVHQAGAEARQIPTRSSVIYNGIEIEQFAAIAAAPRDHRSSFHFVAVGQLRPAKNYPSLLEALRLVDHDAVDVRVTIVGGGSVLGQLRELALNLGVQDRVFFAGEAGNVAPFLADADAFLSASLWEGLPVSMIEAMAAGLPLLVTDVGGNSELVSHNVEGLLVAPTPKALASGIEAMASASMEQLESMSAQAEEKARHFNIDSISHDWERLYLRLLARGSPNA